MWVKEQFELLDGRFDFCERCGCGIGVEGVSCCVLQVKIALGVE